jgi:hypothetical protein
MPEPSNDEIAKVAYEHWINAGSPEGHDRDDWEYARTSLQSEVKNPPVVSSIPWIGITLVAALVVLLCFIFLPKHETKPEAAESSSPKVMQNTVHGKGVIYTEIDTIRPNCGVHGHEVDADSITVHETNTQKQVIRTVQAYRIWCSDGVHLVSLTK